MSLLLAGGAPPPTLADDESGWWSGRQLVQAALSTALATALLTTVAAQTVQLDQSEIVPAPVVITLDEDFYLPTPPTPAGIQQLSQWQDDGNQLIPKLDEDYWPLSVQTRTPSQFLLQPFTLDSSEIVPQPVTFQPDEDYWQLLVSTQLPVQSLLQPFAFDTGDFTPAPITFQPDEDRWAPPAPWPQPILSTTYLLLWQDTDLPQFTPIPPSTPLQRHRLGFGYAAGNPSFHF